MEPRVDPSELENDALHRQIAARVRADPSIIEAAKARLERWIAKDGPTPLPVRLERRDALRLLPPAGLAAFLESQITGDEMDTLRLSASDGSLLARYDRTALGTAGMFAIDASDHIIGSSTGAVDQACLRQTLAADTFGFTKCIDLKTVGCLANGLAIAGTGDIAWLHYDLQVFPPTRFTLHRLTSAHRDQDARSRPHR